MHRYELDDVDLELVEKLRRCAADGFEVWRDFIEDDEILDAFRIVLMMVDGRLPRRGSKTKLERQEHRALLRNIKTVRTAHPAADFVGAPMSDRSADWYVTSTGRHPTSESEILGRGRKHDDAWAAAAEAVLRRSGGIGAA